MTLPNLISIFRILLVPVFLVFITNNRFLAGLMIFVLAGISDGADGLVARLFNQKSRLGSILDPLADKFLLVAAFVALAGMNIIPLWLTLLVITRDFLILLGANVAISKEQESCGQTFHMGKGDHFFSVGDRFPGSGGKRLSSVRTICVHRLRGNGNPDHNIGVLVHTVLVFDDEWKI